MADNSLLDKLYEMRKQAALGGGEKRIEVQRGNGRMTARERIAALLDPQSFRELDAFVIRQATGFGLEEKQFLGDGVVTGYGTIAGRLVYVYAQDFTVLGGSLGQAHAEKICKAMDMAVKNGAPMIGISDSGGARIQEGVDSLAGYAEIFLRNTMASGVIPQISVIMGPCAGGAVYSPAMTDWVFMVKGTSHMFITGPEVVKAVTREVVTLEELGGAQAHNAVSGVSHFMAANEQDCLDSVKQLLNFIPQNNMEDPPFLETSDDPQRMDEELNNIIPDNPNKPYDMKEVIRRVVDDGNFFETHELFARNIITAFARMGGLAVGVVAQQPSVLAGVLDIDSSDKAARFVRFCDSFNIPLIVFEDVPGFMPGVTQEHGGIIRHGAKLIYAFCEATVPKVTVITRKAYGGAYIVMNSRHIRSDMVFAWPTAEIAVMGPEGAVNIVFRKELANAEDLEVERARLIGEYRDRFANPYVAASRGYIDDVIEPKETRPRLIQTLHMLQNKRDTNPPKKHGNIPL